MNETKLVELREKMLNEFKQQQEFLITSGKYDEKQDKVFYMKWKVYKNFLCAYNLRQVLKNEVIIEFDFDDKAYTLDDMRRLSNQAIEITKQSLKNNNISFEIWDFNGKSPHLHIKNLPISKYEDNVRPKIKLTIAKKYVPNEYHELIDTSNLGNKTMIALEWCQHFKKTKGGINRGVKTLIYSYNANGGDKQ